MSDDANIIDIDSIVLEGTAHMRADEIHALVNTEIRRRLRNTGFSAARGVAATESEVANAIANSVERSIQISRRPTVVD